MQRSNLTAAEQFQKLVNVSVFAVLIGFLLIVGKSILLPIFVAVISVYILTTASDWLGRQPVVGAWRGPCGARCHRAGAARRGGARRDVGASAAARWRRGDAALGQCPERGAHGDQGPSVLFLKYMSTRTRSRRACLRCTSSTTHSGVASSARLGRHAELALECSCI